MYSTMRACEMTGTTFRQADHWAREGVVRPTVEARGSGTQREYTFEDVVRMRIVRGLTAIGMGLADVRKVVKLTYPMPEGAITMGEGVRVVVDVGQVMRELTARAGLPDGGV